MQASLLTTRNWESVKLGGNFMGRSSIATVQGGFEMLPGGSVPRINRTFSMSILILTLILIFGASLLRGMAIALRSKSYGIVGNRA